MTLVPWDVLGGGRLQTEKQIQARREAGEGLRGMWGPEQTEDERKTSKVLEEVAQKVGASTIQQVALAYVMQKARNVFPLVGGRKVEHLHENIKALNIQLSDEDIKDIENAKAFDLGFPMSIVGDNPKETGISPPLLSAFASMDWQAGGGPISKTRQ